MDPTAGVVITKDGALYGITYGQGQYGYGSAFELTPGSGNTWTETVLHNFRCTFPCEPLDGGYPAANLIFDSAGALYGTTRAGGASGRSTIFELAPSGAFTVLYSFGPNETQNEDPRGAVLIGPTGGLYTPTAAGAEVAVAPPATPGDAWTGSVIYTLAVQRGRCRARALWGWAEPYSEPTGTMAIRLVIPGMAVGQFMS